jgi:hypothetical protein
MAGGKPRNIESPDHLEQLFEEYKQWCIDNPIQLASISTVKEGVVEQWRKQVMTMQGFQVFINEKIGDISRYIKLDLHYGNEEYAPIVGRIKEDIAREQIAGAVHGVFNANIVARLNAIKDTTEVTQKIQHTILNNDPIK